MAMLSGFLKHVRSFIKYADDSSTNVLHSRFSHFRIGIACNKEIVVYFHLSIQCFSENIRMI